jgi:hypothetical protein
MRPRSARAKEGVAMTWILLSIILAAGLSVNLGEHDF